MKTKYYHAGLISILFSVSSVYAQLPAQHSPNSGLLPPPAKFITSLKNKKGDLLGDVYMENFKGDVFKKLLIVKKQQGKLDTLYFIDNWTFRNPKGVDIESSKENFNGYRIEHIMNDSIQLFGVGTASSGASDPAIIVWDYKKKIFEVDQTP